MDDDGDQVEPYYEILATGDSEAYRSLKMTVKVPPAFDGHVQTNGYFAYEDSVEEWESITTVEQKYRGPQLRNRLQGEAIRLKPLFDMEQLKDPDTGVSYFLSVLRPHFIKDNEHVFLWRFFKFLNKRRGNADITMWIPSFVIEQKRLQDSWMDLAPLLVDNNDPEYRATLASEFQQRQQRDQQAYQTLQQEFNNNPFGGTFFVDPQSGNPLMPPNVATVPLDPTLQSTMDNYNSNIIKPRHQGQFPIGNHMMSLIFLANSDLSEQQRERLTSHLALRNILMRSYTLNIVFEAFRTLFTTTKTGISDPSVRHGGLQRRHGRNRSFITFDYGGWDDQDGYWAADAEEDDIEGFLDIENDVFWTYNQDTDDWEQANVAGHRRAKAGKGGKGKRRFKKKFRGKFRPYNKKQGKAHFAKNEYDAEDSQWDTASQQSGWHDSYYGKG